MKFYCDFCSNERIDSVFPNLLKTNQETIMNAYMVCDTHKSTAIAKLTKKKMYKEAK